MTFKRTGGEEAWKGRMLSVRNERYVYDDGEEVEREVVHHPGAVAVVAHDGETLYLVAHAREAVDDPALLEIPAGKLDEGEEPLQAGKRELAEEIGKGAHEWRHLTSCYSSPGFTDEEVHIYLATDLYDVDSERDEGERMELCPV